MIDEAYFAGQNNIDLRRRSHVTLVRTKNGDRQCEASPDGDDERQG